VSTVYLALGTNLGNREQNLCRAIKLLKINSVIVEKTSRIIETEPAGGPPQGKFLNCVIKVSTQAQPHHLLTIIKEIETAMGRIKTVVNGPRIIDIDILLYDNIQIHTDTLIIPHPRMREREFVMRPLEEIAADAARKLFS
jgi:2-amino-4-hydroxy-6-hydroxymethyldihydropteridine diphosphokinase